MPKHKGTLISLDDIPNSDIEARIYLRDLAQDFGHATTVVRFDRPVYAAGSHDPQETYRYAIIPEMALTQIADQGLLADGASRRVSVEVDRLKQGLVAFDFEPADPI